MSATELLLLRRYLSEATIGAIYKADQLICHTLERPREINNKLNQPDNPETAPNESCCIPEGDYEVEYVFSPRFQRKMLRLREVPGRDGILIHPANYVDQLKGCIAPASYIQDMRPKETDKIEPNKRWIASQSKQGFEWLVACLPKTEQGKILPFKLTIKAH